MSTASSPSLSTCPRCGRSIPDNAVLGACPHCLLAAGFVSEPATPANVSPPSLAELASEFPELDLLELLGSGGMGAVYKARQRNLDRLVALKLLRTGLDADPTFAERFVREARALAQLNHPGIVTLYEFGRTPGGLFFILMEFVDGVNLRQLLATGRLAPREALAIVPPLCDALQYAHDRGLVHRDIKPENILIDRVGRVKVADFGLAKLAIQSESPADAPGHSGSQGDFVSGSFAIDLTEAGKVMGTPRYMAPEQRERPDQVDHRADIYALGVVLYQMLTGELPDAKHLQPPSRRVQIDVRLDQIILRALEKDPSQRYQNAGAMKTQVENVSDDPSLPAAGVRSASNGKTGGRLRLRWAWTVLAGAATFTLAGYFLLKPDPTTPPSSPLERSQSAPDVATSAQATKAAVATPTETERKILRLKLEQAQRALEMTRARSAAGLADHSELPAAEEAVAILEAELTGDVAKITQVKVAAAERDLELLTARFQAGLATRLEVDAAQTKLAIARLELAAAPSAEPRPTALGSTSSNVPRLPPSPADANQRWKYFPPIPPTPRYFRAPPSPPAIPRGVEHERG